MIDFVRVDGLAEPNRVRSRPADLANLAEMITVKRSRARPALAAAPVLEAGDVTQFEGIPRLFHGAFVGLDANTYIVGKYIEAHRALPALQPASRFDRLLLGFARSGLITLALADAYAGVSPKRLRSGNGWC